MSYPCLAQAAFWPHRDTMTSVPDRDRGPTLELFCTHLSVPRWPQLPPQIAVLNSPLPLPTIIWAAF
jgi:hypothetical protein